MLVLVVGTAQADSGKLVNQSNSHAYQRFDHKMPWYMARDTCANLGGYLATVTSLDEQNWIYNNDLMKFIDNSGASGVWFGGNCISNSAGWKWITAEAWNYNHWHNNQTGYCSANGYGYVLAASNDTSGYWYASYEQSLEEKAYLCEWDNPPTQPTVVTKPYTFSSGASAKAAEVNADFDTLYQQINAMKIILCRDHAAEDTCK